MSWSIKAVGLRAAVKAKVLAEQNMPAGVKEAIAEMCDDVSAHTPNGISVYGYGHTGGGFSSIGKLEVENIAIELHPIEPTVPPAPPVDNAHVAPGATPFGACACAADAAADAADAQATAPTPVTERDLTP